MKASADDKINVTEKLKFIIGRVENVVGKGENAAFSPFPTMFSKDLLYRVFKSSKFVVQGNIKIALLPVLSSLTNLLNFLTFTPIFNSFT